MERLMTELFFRRYVESARQLEHETNLDVSKYDVCDNVDLNTILQEYEYVQKRFTPRDVLFIADGIRAYFHVKFNRYPKLTKKNGPTSTFDPSIIEGLC